MASKRDVERRTHEFVDAQTTERKSMEDNESGGVLIIPDGHSLFKIAAERRYRFDILPNVVGDRSLLRIPKGKVYYRHEYWQHGQVGPDNKKIACLRKTFGKKCAVCEFLEREKPRVARDDKEGQEALSSMKAKLRCLYWIIDRDGGDGRPQLLDLSYHMFQKVLSEKCDAATERNGYARFYYPGAGKDGGATLLAKFKHKGTGNGWYECTNIEMDDRAKDIPDKVWEDLASLDSLIKEVSYNAMEKILTGEVEAPLGGGSRDDDDDRPRSRKDDDDDDKPRGRSSRDDDDDRPARRGKDDDDDRPAKVATPEEKPSRRGRDDDDDKPRKPSREDDEPAKKSPAAAKGIEPGTYVVHPEVGKAKVVHVSGDGTSLKLEDADGKIHRGMDPHDCKVGIPVEDDDKPAKKGRKPAERELEPEPTKKGRFSDDDDDTPRRPKDDDDDRPARKGRDDDDDDRPARRGR